MSPNTVAQAVPTTMPSEASLYIAATQTASRPRRALKHNDTFVVLDSHGDIGASPGPSDGLFQCDTRFLSRLELLVEMRGHSYSAQIFATTMRH